MNASREVKASEYGMRLISTSVLQTPSHFLIRILDPLIQDLRLSMG